MINLTWASYIEHTISKFNKDLSIIKCNINYVPISYLKYIYYPLYIHVYKTILNCILTLQEVSK